MQGKIPIPVQVFCGYLIQGYLRQLERGALAVVHCCVSMYILNDAWNEMILS